MCLLTWAGLMCCMGVVCGLSVSGGGGVIVVILLWGLVSWALVVLKIAIDMAHSDELFAGHISGPRLCELAGGFVGALDWDLGGMGGGLWVW